MARYQEELRTETRLAILETAIEMFARDGYNNVPVDRIVERIGVAKGTFFLYFPTKGAVLEYWIMTWISNIQRSAEVREGDELLSNLLAVVDEMVRTDRRQLKLVGWLLVEQFRGTGKGGRRAQQARPAHFAYEDAKPMPALIRSVIKKSRRPGSSGDASRISPGPEPIRDSARAAETLSDFWFGTVLSCIDDPGADPGERLRQATKIWHKGITDDSLWS